MITITLEEPEAMDCLATMLCKSADAIEESKCAVRIGLADEAKLWSRRAERLNSIAQALQRAILLQRGITEP